jgi:hypothetical protein
MFRLPDGAPIKAILSPILFELPGQPVQILVQVPLDLAHEGRFLLGDDPVVHDHLLDLLHPPWKSVFLLGLLLLVPNQKCLIPPMAYSLLCN